MAPLPPRELLAAILGIGLGLFLIVEPEAVIRTHTAGRVPTDRTGQYGEEAPVPDHWVLIVRVAGGIALALGLFLATRILL